LALEFAKDFQVVGYDLKEEHVHQLSNGIDPSGEMPSGSFEERKIRFTTDESHISTARVYIVAVPTPVDESNAPDLSMLRSASRTVAENLRPGDYVIYESTVYPGCTEEICLPILEEVSGLEMGKDFKLGYSPERINPGDKTRTLTKITKVVSGCDDEALLEIARIYRHIIEGGVHEAPSIAVAEASKVVENSQRDVNIALMNELSVLIDALDIDTEQVLEAARTK
jgi:UDP-N-acetyl-D-galactosamine dehydrogenase